MKRIAAALLFLSFLAVQARAVPICQVQQYDPETGYSPLVGQTVAVTGVVTVPAGVFLSGLTSMYIRGIGDDVCGLNIFSATSQTGAELGDIVTVTGVVTEYPSSGPGSTTEIVFDETGLTVIERADTAYVKPVEMYTGFVGREENEGKLVTVTGQVFGREGSREIVVNDGSGPIAVFDFARNFESDSTWKALRFGDEVTFTGIVNQYDSDIPFLSDYQLWPRKPTPPYGDLVTPKCVPDMVTSTALLRIADAEDNEVSIFCPQCPETGGRVFITFNGPHTWRTKLRIFDVYGREVATLSDYFTLCGSKVYEWDGRNELMEYLPMGLYHVVVTSTDPATGEDSQTAAPIVIGRKLR